MNSRLTLILLSIFIGAAAVTLYTIRLRQKKQAGHIPGAYKALVLWSHQRAYPDVRLPDRGFFHAFQRQRAALKKGPAPYNVAGPTACRWGIGGRYRQAVYCDPGCCSCSLCEPKDDIGPRKPLQ